LLWTGPTFWPRTLCKVPTRERERTLAPMQGSYWEPRRGLTIPTYLPASVFFFFFFFEFWQPGEEKKGGCETYKGALRENKRTQVAT
jgi:hypothetical protein